MSNREKGFAPHRPDDGARDSDLSPSPLRNSCTPERHEPSLLMARELLERMGLFLNFVVPRIEMLLPSLAEAQHGHSDMSARYWVEIAELKILLGSVQALRKQIAEMRACCDNEAQELRGES